MSLLFFFFLWIQPLHEIHLKTFEENSSFYFKCDKQYENIFRIVPARMVFFWNSNLYVDVIILWVILFQIHFEVNAAMHNILCCVFGKYSRTKFLFTVIYILYHFISFFFLFVVVRVRIIGALHSIHFGICVASNWTNQNGIYHYNEETELNTIEWKHSNSTPWMPSWIY